MEEAFLEIYSLASLGCVNNTTVFISKLSTLYYCVTWWQSHIFVGQQVQRLHCGFLSSRLVKTWNCVSVGSAMDQDVVSA